jgi:hypothetical protein
MKRFLLATVAASLTLAAGSVSAADVGVSISIGDPNFYGRIDIGDYPRPRLIYAEPVVVERVHVVETPVYMRVPPGHAKHWSKHCREYDACGRRVYFVQDSWYNDVYVPRYRERHGKHHDHDDHHDDHGHPGKGHGKGKGHKD